LNWKGIARAKDNIDRDYEALFIIPKLSNSVSPSAKPGLGKLCGGSFIPVKTL
jgi:hypothetical protein